MPDFNLYRANVIGDQQNCKYPHTVPVGDEESLRRAVWQDYVAVEYKGGYRSGNNFVRTNCLALDCDNDYSDNPEFWATPEIIMQVLPDVTVGFHFSRHNNLPKEGKSARPRFHCFFLIDEMTDASAYSALKKRINSLFPYFDTKALDAARFFFGTEDPEVMFHAGTITLNECLDMYYPDDPFDSMPDAHETIPQGSRNSTMYLFAVKVLKRFGPSDDAKNLFREQAGKCVPPLEDQELKTIWRSALKFYKGTIQNQPGYVKPQDYAAEPQVSGEDPIPFSRFTTAPFPTDALPEDIARYVSAVAESTQTPVDMAGTVALSILSVCLQGKYRIQGKADWLEPLNTYALVIATPSERKSAVLNMMLRPLNSYELQYNQRNAAAMESSKMRRRVLERRQKAIEEQVAKGKAEVSEMEKIAEEIANFTEEQPMQLYVDDITTEKLVSVIAANKGRAALVSSEGGIFDTLAGIYTKNVNIDVMLKGYSGDPIRVDRIGRESESVMNPALTVLLMAQPNVVSNVLGNKTFRGRGLTARFLYCMPPSQVGSRRFDSVPVSEDAAKAYDRKIVNLLDDEYPNTPQLITLSDEAYSLITAFAEDLEPKLATEYAEIADWAGKLVGNTVRIAALLCRAGIYLSHDFLDDPEDLVVDARTMQNAILLGQYYLSNALAAYDALPEKPMHVNANRILQMIQEKKLTEFDRRAAMRYCTSFKRVDEIQPVLDFIEDYGYIFQQPVMTKANTGRPPLPRYTVNPKVHQMFCHSVGDSSGVMPGPN